MPVQFEFPQVIPARLSQVRPLERQFDRRLQESELVSRVVPFALEQITVDGFFGEQTPKPVGQLDFASRAAAGGGEFLEDGRRKDVASDDGQVGRRLARLWLLDHVVDAKQPAMRMLVGDGVPPDDAVG